MPLLRKWRYYRAADFQTPLTCLRLPVPTADRCNAQAGKNSMITLVLHGTIDEVTVYNRTLTQKEIQEDMNGASFADSFECLS
jgi:hypothetical protein